MTLNEKPPSLRIISVAPKVPMEASKWLDCQVLVDADEMRTLFAALEPFYIYQSSSVMPLGEGGVSHAEFLKCYSDYVSPLQNGQLPEESAYRSLFSSVFTVIPEALYAVAVGNEQQVIRISQPVVQLQAHRMDYSPADGKFHSMTFGVDSIVWGMQFSYPQLFRDPTTKQVEQVNDSPRFPNTQLFRNLQRWVRHHTVPTPILVGGQKLNIPVRLGKQCFSWINRHPQLLRKGLQVPT
jgi:hypothetical protein